MKEALKKRRRQESTVREPATSSTAVAADPDHEINVCEPSCTSDTMYKTGEEFEKDSEENLKLRRAETKFDSKTMLQK
jgi:hypothetical protein